ncbi:MAG TPA: hypothetical protein VM554_10690 [Acidisarcina sp.]|nr:hypothetical protein [Acidisarcina sp.]
MESPVYRFAAGWLWPLESSTLPEIVILSDAKDLFRSGGRGKRQSCQPAVTRATGQ